MSNQIRFLSISILFSLLANIFIFAINYMALTKYGSMANLDVFDLVAILSLSCLIVIFPIFLFLIIFKKTRSFAIKSSISSFIFFVVFIFGTFINAEIRAKEFERLVERSAYIVESINDFEKETGAFPATLDQLVPKYFESVPQTGMGAYPDYNYIVGKEASKFEGNPWVIIVNVSTGTLNFDFLMYFPKGNYPQDKYGGYVKRVHDWAYLYE